MSVTINSIARVNGRIEVRFDDKKIMYLADLAELRAAAAREKDGDLAEALKDILARDATLASPELVTDWRYTMATTREVL